MNSYIFLTIAKAGFMGLLQQIITILNSNNQDNGFLSSILNFLPTKNNANKQDITSTYYQLPTYNYATEQKTLDVPQTAQQNEQSNNFANIIKIAGVLLQFLLNKDKKETNAQTNVQQPIVFENQSKIDKLKRTNNNI